MNEYINTATNHKVLAVHWTGSKQSTLQLPAGFVGTKITTHSYDDYQEVDTDGIFNHPKSVKVVCITTSGASYHYNYETLHKGDYLVMRTKCAFADNDPTAIRLSIVKPSVFKKWYKKYTPNHSRTNYVLMNTWSNNTYDKPDPIEPVASSGSLPRLVMYQYKMDWENNYSELYIVKVHKA